MVLCLKTLAGCFVSNGTAMLAVKLTYDGNLFDIPGALRTRIVQDSRGGRTDGQEPATRTAERETFEESGYQATSPFRSIESYRNHIEMTS